MNKKKRKDKEIWPDEMECARFRETGGYRVREIYKKIKKLNGKFYIKVILNNNVGTSLFSLKFFVIIILFYFLRLNEALTINPDSQSRKGGLFDTLASMAGENNPLQKGLEFLNPLADVVSGVTGKSGLLNKFMPGESDSDESTPAPVKKYKEMPIDASSAVGSSSSSNSDGSSDSSDEETPNLKSQVAEMTSVQPGHSVSQSESSDSDSETESETSESDSLQPVKESREPKNRNFEEVKPKAPKQNSPFSERLERPVTDHTNEIFESFKQRNKPREQQENEKQHPKVEVTPNDTKVVTRPGPPPQFRETPEQFEVVEKPLEQKPKKEKVNAATEQEVEPTAPKKKPPQPEPKPVPADTEDIYTAGEVSAPSENAFKANLKSKFPQKEVLENDKGPSPDDDFELQEIEKVVPSKVDPSITKQLDTAFLRRQKQSQMIGSQIPIATSYEYNRDSQVLEPKFETPKVMGGIIQTLTDKEAKLRRMEKRKLKIQHDLNLFISKESANVVNILNNGEMLKLQKYHPLVYMRLLEVFQTQYSLDILIKKDIQKVNKYNKSWYLNSTPGAKESFIEEMRRYTRDPELYGKFKKPNKIRKSRENIYKKLELFHNDYICQRIVRENQYAEKVLRSMEKQSGLYLAPYYHNIVPGLGNLWLIKNFERYFTESLRAKGTLFGKVAPTVVGRFMLMVENGTVLPSTPSSQVAIHALVIMLSMIIDGVKTPSTFLGKKKFYGFMSLCDSVCADQIFEQKDKKNHMSTRQVEFLKWVMTFHSEDLLLIDTAAQRIILNNMYAITREDIYRTSPKNVQLRIQSEFAKPRKKPRESLLELEESEDDHDESLLELESELEANREKKLSKENEKLLRDLGEKRRQEYRKMQLEKVLEQQRSEAKRQKEQEESEIFKRAMKERENLIRRAHMELTKQKEEKEEGSENTLFAKEDREEKEKEAKKPTEKEGEVKEKMLYENVKNKLENLGTTYKIFLNRFMTGYHAPGEEVNEKGESPSIVPFHVFLQSNRNSEGYDDQFVYVTEILTDLVNLASKENNAYFHSLNTYLMIRSIYSALQSFESSKTRKVIGSKTLGSLLRWLNTDSNRYVQNLPKKFLPLTSLSLQLVMFFQEVVESYSNKLSGSLRLFFKGLVRYPKGSLKTPKNFARLNANFDAQVIYHKNRYNASLHALKELVDEYKNTFISKPSIPSPIIQYVTVFTGLWVKSDSENLSFSERGSHRARKMFLLSFLSNKKSLAEMGTEMILKNCLGLKMLHLGCVTKGKSAKENCKQLSIKIKKKHILNVMRLVESTSMDPVDVIRVASDASRRCVANKTVRGHVGAPVLSYLELSEDKDSEGSEPSESSPPEVIESDSEEVGEYGEPKAKTPKKSFTHYANKVIGLFKKQLTPEEEELMVPHFTDILMLHSELTHRMHCYSTQVDLVNSLLKELKSAKDEPDAKQIITNVFARYRTIEVVQGGMASSVHRLVCPFMMDAQDSIRIPLQANIISHVINKIASKVTANLDYKDMFVNLKGKIDLLVPSYESFSIISDLAGCVFVGTRNYNGVYYSGGYAPFGEVDKPKNILLKPGEGRLVYDGENFVPELTALNDVSDLLSIKIVHERDYDRYVYQVRGDKGPVLISERAFALEHPNFVVRAHVLITAKALLGLGFDMGRIIWCGNRYGWVADFVLNEVVPSSDIPVYNGRYWLLTSQLSVKDVVGGVPIKFVNESVRGVLSPSYNYDEEDLLDRNVNEVNIEFTSRGRKIGEIHSHPGSPEVSSSEEEDDASEFLVNSAGDGMSATPGAVKSVKSASFNPVGGRLTLDLDMPDFLVSQ